MEEKYCSHCSEKIIGDNQFCIQCGQRAVSTHSITLAYFIIGSLVGLMVSGIILMIIISNVTNN